MCMPTKALIHMPAKPPKMVCVRIKMRTLLLMLHHIILALLLYIMYKAVSKTHRKTRNKLMIKVSSLLNQNSVSGHSSVFKVLLKLKLHIHMTVWASL